MQIITHMWQSRVEIEHCSIVYFDHITAFEVLKHSTSIMGGAHTRSWILDTFTQHKQPQTEVLH